MRGFRCSRGLKAISTLVMAMAPWQGSAQTACPSLVPEVTEYIEPASFPSGAARWRAAERIWKSASIDLKTGAKRQIAENGISPIVDAIQGRTHDLTREAIRRRRTSLSDDLLELWTMPLAALVSRDAVRAYYVTPGERIGQVSFDRPYEMWVGSDGVETTLYAALYLAGAMDLFAEIARQPAPARSEAETNFARRTAQIALSHYQRWAFDAPGIWQLYGWGCRATGLKLPEFTEKRLNRTFANAAGPYCDAPTDLDLVIAIGIVDLLAGSAAAPELVAIAPDEHQRLIELVRLQARFIASRFVRREASDRQGRVVPTVDFDPATWALHPDFAYAGDESDSFPDRVPPPKDGVGWDFSHGARIAWMLETFSAHAEIVGPDVDWAKLQDRFARQIAYRVVDGDPDLPRFRNYLDGSNGWYRVNYSDRARTGTRPYGLSRAYFSMPWARLSAHAPLLMRIASGAWRLITGATAAHCAHLQHFYTDGAYWVDGRAQSQPLSGTQGSLDFLPFLAVAPVR